MALSVVLGGTDVTHLLRTGTLRITTTDGSRESRCDLALNMAPDYALPQLVVADGATTYFDGTVYGTSTTELGPGSPVTRYSAHAVTSAPATSQAPFGLTDTTPDLALSQIAASVAPYCWWRLGEASGSNAIDEQSVQDGTYVNAPTLGVTGALSNISNTAVTLNGSDEYLAAGAAHLRGQTGLSIAAWVKTSESAGEQVIYEERSTSGGACIILCLTTGVRFQWRDDAGTLDTIDAVKAVYNGQWHHIAVTKYGADVVIYVDGKAVHAESLTATDTQTSTMTANIGRDPYTGTKLFNGSLDEVMIFRYELDPEQVALLYAARDLRRYVSLQTDQTTDGVDPAVFTGTAVTLDAGLAPGQVLGVVSANHSLATALPVSEVTLSWINATTRRWEVSFGDAPIKLAAAFP